MRTWSRFRMILDRKDRKRLMPQAGDGFVVEVDVGDLDIGRQAFFRNRKAVVMGCYLYLAGGQVLDRLVAAAVAEF